MDCTSDKDSLLRFEECETSCNTSTRINIEQSVEGNVTSEPTPSILSWSFYQRYFDVNTALVQERLLWSFLPLPSDETLTRYTKPLPDLYGPFWVCITLIFFIAITGNVSDYLHRDDEHWRYDFKKVSIAASVVFTYLLTLPALLWAWWRNKREVSLGLMDVISLYGYSLAIYIPFSLLWTVPQTAMQWVIAFVLAALSGSFIVRALWKPLSSQRKRFVVLAAVLAVQFCFTVALQLMFYRHAKKPYSEISSTAEMQSTTEALIEKVVKLSPLIV